MPTATACDFILAATGVVAGLGEGLKWNGLAEQERHKRERKPAGSARGHYA
jgi:hypothetical protein